MINSNLTGPMDGTFPPAAKTHAGENKIIDNMINFLLLLRIRDLKLFFIY
jgi:hypothetical protein